MKFSEHLLFLALMIPTIALLVVAAILLAQPAHPAGALRAAEPALLVAHQRGERPVHRSGYAQVLAEPQDRAVDDVDL